MGSNHVLDGQYGLKMSHKFEIKLADQISPLMDQIDHLTKPQKIQLIQISRK